MFQRLLVALLSLIWWLAPVAAQNSTISYCSDDGAVQFSYSPEWTLESQNVVFNTLYQFTLLTPEYNPFQSSAVRSQIFIELINAETNDFARNFETASDFASYTLNNSFGLTVELEETEIADHPAVRSAFIPYPDGEHTGRLYAMLGDDGWAVVASASTPITPQGDNHNNFEHGESELLAILASLQFDATAAATPFERNLEVYDTSNVVLGAYYTSDDSSFSLEYPIDWEIETDNILTNSVSNIAYLMNFIAPDDGVKVSIMVLKIGDEAFNQPQDEDNPQEYMQSRRNAESGEVREFRISEYDAVSVVVRGHEESVQEISYMIADEWIATAIVTATSDGLLAEYEPSVVAVLGSTQFAIGAAYIDFPILNVTLPEPWEVVYYYSDDITNSFVLESADATQFENAVLYIYLENLEANGLKEQADNGLEALGSSIFGVEIERNLINIAEYEVLRTPVIINDKGRYNAIFLILVNDEWFFATIAQADTPEEVEEMLQAVDTIINNMEITLPED